MLACFLDIIDGICEHCNRTVTFSRRPMEIASLFTSSGMVFGMEQPSCSSSCFLFLLLWSKLRSGSSNKLSTLLMSLMRALTRLNTLI